MSLQPATLAELQAIIQTNHGLLPRGGGSKPALSSITNNVVMLDLSRLSGIIEYEPGFIGIVGIRMHTFYDRNVTDNTHFRLCLARFHQDK